ncbi:MAG TPA: methyltransferase, partial [Acidimicrobium sp.]|nr:methyltransferase [Acidimicrobium sp.]
MTTTPARRGGRATRTAMRAAPLTDDIKPVRPGMPSGRYKALTDSEVLKIHEAAINVLENIGIADAIPSTLEYLLPKGCKLDSNGRLLFPRSLIEHTLEIAARNFPLYAQDPKFDMEPWGTNTYFGTAGAAVYIADYDTGEYRESVSQDAYDIAR